ncbi:hypothetical protein C8J56DRAFT_1060445 [Mycena floridula]|nr:hypothetical protein C8J56DRAFT_1060445 [Mycena floridula]
MPAKRKSEAIVEPEAATDASLAKAPCLSTKENASSASKKAKASGSKQKEAAPASDSIELEYDGVYDDCNEIRRKIRLSLKEPSFKITHWLEEIGGINRNSYNRFMKLSGPYGGAENGLYKAVCMILPTNSS